MTPADLIARHKGFTPGPWETQESPNGGLLLIRGNHSDRFKRHPQTHLQIVPEADARLIADAPALLELAQRQARRIAVLEAAVRQWASECWGCGGTGENVVGHPVFGPQVTTCPDCADMRAALEETQG